jgi:phosphatidyl-myo-inositol alpha-mannosyltransferase
VSGIEDGVRSDPDGRRVVVFVALAAGLGGSTRSLATILQHIGTDVMRVLAAPEAGPFPTFLAERSLVDEHVPIPKGGPARRRLRPRAAYLIAKSVWGHRGRVIAIHANGPEELNVAAPAALLAGVPLVVWCHAREASTWMRRLAPVWRLALPRIRWAAVSPTARNVLVQSRMASRTRVEILPNPIDPSDVVARHQENSGETVVAYLGSDAHYKGFQLLPDVVDRMKRDQIQWRLYTDQRSVDNEQAWERLRSMSDASVFFVGKVGDVRDAYAACDIVFCPSLQESFCRVAAEAMLNGIPVVGSDLEPLRDLLGEEEAGLLFPVGDAASAATAIRRLASDAALRTRLGANGRTRAESFGPERIAARFRALYGLDTPHRPRHGRNHASGQVRWKRPR